MASSTLTYGKKRGLLDSLGPKRRQKLLEDQETVPVQNQERLALSVNACHEAVKQGSWTKAKVDPASIEEIASALLDDSSTSPDGEDAVQQSDKDVLESSTSTPGSLEDSIAETVEDHPRSSYRTPSKGKKNEKGSDHRSGAPRIQKNSPNSPRKPSARASKARSGTNSSFRRKESGLVRPLASPVKPSMDRSQHIVMRNIGAPCLLPHNTMVDGTPVLLFQSKQNSPACADVFGPDEIQQKVAAMLAATEALKPSSTSAQLRPERNSNSSTSKMSRMVPSKVLAKVSNALDWLHVKPSDTGSKPRAKLRKQSTQQDSDALKTPNAIRPSHVRTSSINTIEIRLNEGDNLNRKKVQQMVGGRVSRKPVAQDGKSLRSGRSTDDPFARRMPSRSPNTLKNPPNLGTDAGLDMTPLTVTDPFESENGFENDLEDRILSTSPVGSSTPRIRVHRVPTPSLDESGNEIQFSSEQPTRASLGRVTIMLTEYGSPEARTLKKTPDEMGQRRLVRSADYIDTRAIRDDYQMNISECKGMKKHPSPSKMDLEDLEAAFQQYTELKRRGAEDELDELASHFAPPADLLASRDRNQLFSNRLSVQDRKMPTSRYDTQSHAKSRIPRPADDLKNGRHQIRLAPAYRPMIPRAEETDELQ